jgi:phosphopantothenate---cysteine ligase (CTP)
MRVLVTAGNTLVPIDRVRCLTNIFTGKTGSRIALHAFERGHAVTLLTSHPEVVKELGSAVPAGSDRWAVRAYRTFEDLEELLKTAVREQKPDAVIHCAAVSDYGVGGVYAPASGTFFDPEKGCWETHARSKPALVDRSAGKVKSDEPELWLRLVRTPKLIDRFRREWDFQGVLVKFKLEVDVGEARLLEIAEQSRCQSAADLMVANTLEGMQSWAYLGPLSGQYERVPRQELPVRLIEAVERLHEEKIRA